MVKKNCWEFMNCGRQPGGGKVSLLGPCPTVGFFAAHSLNDGINGGRACWAITGTFCNGEVQGSFLDKIRRCADCDFFHHVQTEEGQGLVTTPEILKRITATNPPNPAKA